MAYAAAKLLIAYVLATLLACGVGAWLAARYRRALLPLMSAPMAASALAALSPTQAMAKPLSAESVARELTLADHQRAMRWLVLALLALSLLIALTRGVLWALYVKPEAQAFDLARFMMLTFVYAWPVLPALGLIWRWRWRHLALAMSAWYALSVGLALLASTNAQTVSAVVVWLAWEAGWPALALMLLTLPRTRATAPWLWLPMSMIVLMALAGTDVFNALVRTESPLIVTLAQFLSPLLVMLLFMAVGVALAAWPAWQFGRVLAHAYSEKLVSELIVVYSSAWVLNLVFEALTDGPILLLPLLWLPVAVWVGRQVFQRKHLADRSNAPTLMVLRVFKQERNAAALFEEVVERWRVSGRTVLIAGTDLVNHTLDAADLLGFLEGRLAERFVVSEDDVQRRLDEFDWERDPDGRFRVNECYCHDRTWKYALAALVHRSSCVLIDLRGFTADNMGCRYELAVLARAQRVRRVVAVIDDTSDLRTAISDTEGAPAGRFTWLRLPLGPGARRAARQRVMAALLTPTARSANVGTATA